MLDDRAALQDMYASLKMRMKRLKAEMDNIGDQLGAMRDLVDEEESFDDKVKKAKKVKKKMEKPERRVTMVPIIPHPIDQPSIMDVIMDIGG